MYYKVGEIIRNKNVHHLYEYGIIYNNTDDRYVFIIYPDGHIIKTYRESEDIIYINLDINIINNIKNNILILKNEYPDSIDNINIHIFENHIYDIESTIYFNNV